MDEYRNREKASIQCCGQSRKEKGTCVVDNFFGGGAGGFLLPAGGGGLPLAPRCIGLRPSFAFMLPFNNPSCFKISCCSSASKRSSPLASDENCRRNVCGTQEGYESKHALGQQLPHNTHMYT